MYLSHLALTRFRNYDSVQLELPAGPVVFTGSNGQGKTNLVEAAAYLASLSSHRAPNDTPLIRIGDQSAVVAGRLVRDERSISLRVEILAGRANKAWLNRSPVPRAREVVGYARVVTFSPEDLHLVRGDPEQRRRYLDDLLVLRSPRLTVVRSEYERALRQRNALLRGIAESGGRRDSAGLREWDEALATLGGELAAARYDLVTSLAPRLQATYDDLAPGAAPAVMAYAPSSCLASVADGPAVADLGDSPERWREALLEALARVRREELARGVTVVGPHRDDVALRLGETPVRGYASHGEAWTMALGLRLAAFGLLRDDWQDTPILVLDDVFAELDQSRRDRLVATATEAEQVLVTAAVAADVPPALRGARFDVRSGSVLVHREQASAAMEADGPRPGGQGPDSPEHEGSRSEGREGASA